MLVYGPVLPKRVLASSMMRPFLCPEDVSVCSCAECLAQRRMRIRTPFRLNAFSHLQRTASVPTAKRRAVGWCARPFQLGDALKL